MPAWYAKLMGRHPAGKEDHPVAATQAAYQVGVMQVFSLGHAVSSNVVSVSDAWVLKVSGSATSPLLLKRIEINNNAAVANTFSLAIMTVGDGAPGTSNAFLAWDTIVGPLEVWVWTGEVPLIDRYVYVKGGVAGMSMYWEAEEIDH